MRSLRLSGGRSPRLGIATRAGHRSMRPSRVVASSTRVDEPRTQCAGKALRCAEPTETDWLLRAQSGRTAQIARSRLSLPSRPVKLMTTRHDLAVEQTGGVRRPIGYVLGRFPTTSETFVH